MKKILAVATNSNPALRAGVKTGLWLSELSHFVEVMHMAGYEVVIASPLGGVIPLDESSVSAKNMADPANVSFMKNQKLRASLEHSVSISTLNTKEFDAIYLSGGHGTVWDFRQSEPLQNKITEFYSSGKIVSGVCHGVAGFIDSKDENGKMIVKGKRVTGFSNFEDTLVGGKKFIPFLLEAELRKSGALYRKNVIPFTERVEIDSNLITGQNPQSAKAVGQAVVKALSCK